MGKNEIRQPLFDHFSGVLNGALESNDLVTVLCYIIKLESAFKIGGLG